MYFKMKKKRIYEPIVFSPKKDIVSPKPISGSSQFLTNDFLERNMPNSNPFLKCPKTSILSQLMPFNPIHRIIHPISNKGLETSTRHVHKIKLSDNRKFVLKCFTIEASNQRKLDNIAREFFIGRTFGTFTNYIAKVVDLRHLNYENEGKTELFTEMLIEYGGKSLDKYIGKLEEPEKINIIHQLIYILELSQKLGIAHFDIKPLNIIWNRKLQRLKIIDFGTSVTTFDSPENINKTINNNRLVGFTAMYAPPELIDVKNVVPLKADVFSFGKTIVEIFLNNTKILDIKDLDKFKEKLEVEFFTNYYEWTDFVLKCLEFKPENRPSFSEIRQIFDKIVCEKHGDLILPVINEKIDYYQIGNGYYNLRQYEVAALHYEIWLNDDFSENDIFCTVCSRLMALRLNLQEIDEKYTKTVEFSIEKYVKAYSTNGLYKLIQNFRAEVFNLTKTLTYDQSNFKTIIDNSIEIIIKEIESCIKNKELLIDFYRDIAENYNQHNNTEKQYIYLKKYANLLSTKTATDEINLSKELELLAVKFFEFNDDIEAMKLSQISTNILIKTYGNNDPNITKAYENIGSKFILSKNRDRAVKFYDKILELLLTKSKSTDYYKISRIYEILGDAYSHNFSETDTANIFIEYYEKAAEMLLKSQKNYFSEIIHLYEKIIEKCEKQKLDHRVYEYFNKIIELSKNKLGENHQKIAELYSNYANKILNLNQYEKSINYFLCSIRIIDDNNTNSQGFLVSQYDGLSKAFLLSGNNEKALEYCEIATEYRKNLSDNSNIGLSYAYLAEIYAFNKNHENAMKLCEKSCEENYEFTKKCDSNTIKGYELVLNAYLIDEHNMYEKAENCCEKCVLLISKLLKNDNKIPDLYMNLADYYKKMQNLAKVDEILQKSIKIITKLYKNVNTEVILEYYEKYADFFDSDLNIKTKIEWYNKCLSMYFEYKSHNTEKILQLQEKLVEFYVFVKDYDNSIKLLLQIFESTENQQNSPKLYYKISDLYEKINDLPKSEFYRKKAENLKLNNLALSDKYAEYHKMAEQYKNSNKFELAIQFYHKACDNPQSDILSKANLFEKIANCLYNLENYEHAIIYYQKSLEIKEKNLPSENQQVLYKEIAELFFKTHNYSESFKFFTHVIDLCSKYTEKTALDFIEIYDKLAEISAHLKNHEASVQYCITATDIRVDNKRDFLPYFMESYENLMKIYIILNMPEKAFECCENCEIYLSTVFCDNSNLYEIIASAYMSLSKIFEQTKKDYQNSIKSYMKAIEFYRNMFGENHHKIAENYDEIALKYAKFEQFEKCLEFCHKSTEIRKKILGETNKEIAVSYDFVIDWTRLQVKSPKISELIMKLQQTKEKIIGKDTIQNADILYKLSKECEWEHNFEKSLKLFYEAVQIKTKILGENHAEIIDLNDKLIIKYAEAEQFENAIKLCEKNTETRLMILSKITGNVIDSFVKLGSYYANKYPYQKYYEIILAVCEKCSSLISSKIGTDTPLIYEIYDKLSFEYFRNSERNLGCQLLCEQVKIFEKTSNSKPKIAQIYDRISDMSYLDNNVSRGFEFLVKSTEIKQQILPADSIELAKQYESLGEKYLKQGKKQEAIECYMKMGNIVNKNIEKGGSWEAGNLQRRFESIMGKLFE